jgi:hypothetical protein
MAWGGVLLLLGGLVHLNIQSYQERQELRLQVEASRMARRALFRQIDQATRDVGRSYARMSRDHREARGALREIDARLGRIEAKLDGIGGAAAGVWGDGGPGR